MGTSTTTTKVVTKPEPKAQAKRSPRKAAPKPKTQAKPFVYDFYASNAQYVLKDWLTKGFIEILPEGGIEWAYTDDTPCYSQHGTSYPIKMWAEPWERFAPILGVTTKGEVEWFWAMSQDRHAAAISLL